MHQTCSANASSGASSRSNMLLVVVAVLLTLVLTREGPGESSAMAQGGAPTGGGLANPADQRNQMIAELRRLSDQVESLRRTMDKPIRVEVVRMPETTASR